MLTPLLILKRIRISYGFTNLVLTEGGHFILCIAIQSIISSSLFPLGEVWQFQCIFIETIGNHG